MKFQKAIRELMKGKIVVDTRHGGNRYFLFGSNSQIYFVHDTEINEDKKQLAIKSNSKPHLLAESWWEDKWEVYEEDQKEVIPKEIMDILEKKIDEATDEELDEALEILENKIKELTSYKKEMAK